MKIELQQESFDTFEGYVNLIGVIAEEATFKVSEEKIQVITMDPSHVAMVDAGIKKEAFDTYTLTEREDMNDNFTVNITEFKKFLGRVNAKEETVSIYQDYDKAKLVIEARKRNRQRRFEVPLLEPYDEEVPQPKIKFHSKLRIVSEAMLEAVKDVNLVTEHIKVRIIDDDFHLSGEGDIGDAYADWSKGTQDILEIDSDEESEATYTIGYFLPIIKECKDVGAVMTLKLSSEMPILIQAEPKLSYLDVSFYLAPCIGV